MKYITLAWNWLVYSSANEQAFSITVKAFLTAIVTYGTVAAGLAHISLPSDLLTQLVDAVVSLFQSILLVVSSIVTVIAFVRKIKSTIDGTNKVINTQ